MTTPSTMRAIKVQSAKEAALVNDAKVPSLRPQYVLVKVECVALNPTDWKHIDSIPTPNATVGCDYSGTVVEVGSEVKKSFKKGDRIAGLCHGVNVLNPEDGAFGEYCVAKGDVQIQIPDNLSFEEAATLGVGIATIGQGLNLSLGLPMPDSPSKDNTPLLIYGGSTATGLFAIQWAKLAGLKVITTCSPRNFSKVKDFGADEAFDYSNPSECSKKIREYTNDKLKYAFDCISEGTSIQICADALSSSGGDYSALLPVKDFPRKDVTARSTLAYTMKGEDISFRGRSIPAKPEEFEFAVRLWALAEKLLAEGKIKCFPDVQKGGLQGIFEGLDMLRTGKVSGQKLVYRVRD